MEYLFNLSNAQTVKIDGAFPLVRQLFVLLLTIMIVFNVVVSVSGADDRGDLFLLGLS